MGRGGRVAVTGQLSLLASQSLDDHVPQLQERHPAKAHTSGTGTPEYRIHRKEPHSLRLNDHWRPILLEEETQSGKRIVIQTISKHYGDLR